MAGWCLVTALLAGASSSSTPAAEALAPVPQFSIASDAPAGLDVSAGWRFRADPGHAGVTGRWDGISLNDRGWAGVTLGAAGETRRGWWRRWVDLPGEWPQVWIAVDGAAPRTDLFINGTPASRDLARFALSSGTAVRDVTDLVHGRRRFLIALAADRPPARIRLAPAPAGWLTDELDRLRVAAQGAPNLPWPSWLRGEGTAWTVYAPFAGGPAGRLGWQGDLEAGGGLAGVSCWAYDRASRRLLSAGAAAGEAAMLRLTERSLPLPEARMGGDIRAVRLSLRVWPHLAGDDPPLAVGVAEATVENLTGHPREVDLIVAVHPFRPSGTPAAIERIRYDRTTQSFLVGDRPVCVLAGAPDAAGTGAFGAGWDVVAALARGDFPVETETVDAERRLATGLAAYRLRLQPYGGRTQTFRVLPGAPAAALTPGQFRAARDVDRKSARAEEELAWRKALIGKERIFLRVPDKAAQDAFHASLGHLLVARSAGDPAAAGPEASAALACAGVTDTAAPGVFEAPLEPGRESGTPDPEARAVTAADWTHQDGLSPAEAFAFARSALAHGDPDAAMKILGWWLARPTTPGAFAWAERVDPVTMRFGGGALPDPVAAARLVLAIRAMVLRESDRALWLAPALPADWVKPGGVVDLRNVPTSFGILPGFALRASPGGIELRRVTAEQLAFRGRGPRIDPERAARPPDGYRWRIPGRRRIRLIRVDGASRSAVPADRIIVLAPDFKRAFVGW